MDSLTSIRIREQNKVVLQPSQLKNVTSAVQKAVMNLLFTYRNCNQLPCLVIQVNKIQINNDMIETFDDNPQMFLDVEYSLTLLQIKSGVCIRGTLVQQFQSHIIVQLFNLFNVVIHEEEINNKLFEWNAQFNSFIYTKNNQVVTLGEEIQIQIIDVQGNQNDQKQFEIKGSLRDRKLTGPIDQLSEEFISEDYAKIFKTIEKSQQLLQSN